MGSKSKNIYLYIQYIGIVIFLIGFGFFNSTVFIGKYALTEEVIINLHGKDGAHTEKSSLLLNATKKNKILDQEFGTPFAFREKTHHLIEDYNAQVTVLKKKTLGLTEAEIQDILNAANGEESVKYNKELLQQLQLEEGKIQKLEEYTSWMYTSEKSYQNFSEFKQLLLPKIKEINNSVADGFTISQDKETVFQLTKASYLGTVKHNAWLWFFLSFGLIIIGSLTYILPMIKVQGPPGIKNNGIYHHASTNRGWIAWLVFIYLIVFYIILYFYPYVFVGPISLVNPVSKILNGGTASQWFLYGFIYSIAMSIMAVRMIIKYRHNRYQIFRTSVVLFFQLIFAFLIPEILIRLNKPGYDFKNAWPLDYDFLFDWNIKNLLETDNLGLFMLIWGIILSLIIVPVMVYFFGKRWYCSWVCGCGGLAETLGDPYRQHSDKSLKAWKFERIMIHSVLVFVVLMTIAVVYSFFHNNPDGYWLSKNSFLVIVSIMALTVISTLYLDKNGLAKMKPQYKWIAIIVALISVGLLAYTTFTQSANVLFVDSYWIRDVYAFLIGSIFAGVIGTGFYPIFGNRVWCRFGCPLAAYLGIIQRFKSRFRITTNGGQCISCGNCSTYCEQGIDVRAYAQRGEDILRASCVGCGVCSAVCPRGVLKLENSTEPKKINDNPLIYENNLFKINPDI